MTKCLLSLSLSSSSRRRHYALMNMAAHMWRACFSRSLRTACSLSELSSVAKKYARLDSSTWRDTVPGFSYSQFKSCRHLSSSVCRFSEADNQEEGSEDAEGEAKLNVKKVTLHPPELSIQYLESKAYKDTYGEDPVWTKYRRNFKGQFPPSRTRKSCIKNGIISTGSPCPLCRDEYLVVHHTNTKLLTQFISPYTGEVLRGNKTGVCQSKQFQLDLAILKAKDLGLITYHVPFRHYNYEEYYPQLQGPRGEKTADGPE